MQWLSSLALFGLLFSVQAYNDGRCTRRGGSCQYKSRRCVDGRYVPRLCGGPSTRQCCISNSPGGGSDRYDDSKCTDRGGRCQTSSRCVGGQYVSGMCGGPSNRRCCFTARAPCSRKQNALACRLLRNSNVRPAKSHPSGQRDNAYAFNNLRDMCNGRKASRSSYRCNAKCNAPGGSTCLSLNLLNYLNDLSRSGVVQINELAGACHSCRSRHYSGLAVDLHKLKDRMETYKRQCRRNSGLAIEERNHIHCQFKDGPHPNFQN